MSGSIEAQLEKIFAMVAGDGMYEQSAQRIQRELERTLTKGGTTRAKVLLTHGVQGEPVGFAILVDSPEKMARWQETWIEEGWVKKDFQIEEGAMELMYLYVKPEYRRLGRASRLLSEIIEWAQAQGVPAVYAYVSDRRNVALKFYVANGAEVIYEVGEEEADEELRANGSPLSAAFLKWEMSDK